MWGEEGERGKEERGGSRGRKGVAPEFMQLQVGWYSRESLVRLVFLQVYARRVCLLTAHTAWVMLFPVAHPPPGTCFGALPGSEPRHRSDHATTVRLGDSVSALRFFRFRVDLATTRPVWESRSSLRASACETESSR